MKFINDISKDRRKIESSIKKYGSKPEHRFYYYKDEEGGLKKNIFVDFGCQRGLLTQKSKKSWNVISDVLAPKEEQLDILLKFLGCAFRKNSIKNIAVEFDDNFRDMLFNNPSFIKKYRTRHGRTLWWPTFNMKKWDGHKLNGKKWKKMRNIKNRFYKNHDVEFRQPRDFSKSQLKGIVKDWIAGRIGNDGAEPTSYYNNIENNFKGFDNVKVMSVDGEPCAINAGWKIVNSKGYYSCVGLLNYKYKGLGEVSNLQDLIFLKKKKFDFVDFGGSDMPLLEFKNKFRPHNVYKTHQFFIYKK